MFGIGMQELLIVAVVALVLVGPKRLPEVAQMLGKSYAQLKKATDGLQEALKAEMEIKRQDDLKKKYPDLAVEDPKPAPAAEGEATAGAPQGDGEIPVNFGDDAYQLSTAHPLPVPAAPPPEGAPAAPPADGKDPKNG
jgi:Tat protein translocase TatB subunit